MPLTRPEGIPQAIRLFVGHSTTEAFRAAGSSGGIGTAILSHLLKSQEVDAVIGAGFDHTDATRPAFRCITNPDDIVLLSGSKYAYLEFAPLAALIEHHRGRRLAVAAPPCFCAALRQRYPDIRFLLSFFCGYNITPQATQYLIEKTKTEPKNITRLDYRGGTHPGGFTLTLKDGTRKHFGKEYYEPLDLMFLRQGCDNCRFFISDIADIILGDAWIKGAPKNTAIVVITPAGDALLKTMFAHHELTLYSLYENELGRMHAHNLRYKTRGHSLIMKILVKIMGNPRLQRWIPLTLLAAAARWRRACCVGIRKDMNPLKTYPS
ncbi:MAG: Coenzyme F420 hydrogenase/dehydrogenase, beta subunit C-terminal domain [Candidatus Omnitrophica bacterium]|nr:Coenzyme F420 hydrogenase/dehydrogenase, beta subunit C-terminal domain [Candidatus Omnitrophota bacterium]